MSEKELVTLTIDGQTVQAPKGHPDPGGGQDRSGSRSRITAIIPGLSIVGSCRMCLVEIEKIPKLQPSCATPVAEGMVVRTRTPETLRNRQSVLEFLLLNHPLDCPVCDQAGECELQNYYMEHGLLRSALQRKQDQAQESLPDRAPCHPGPGTLHPLHPLRALHAGDLQDRRNWACIDRGHRSEIDIFPGHELNNPYSGNVVDICPVGALTDRDFRFKCRVWFLGRTPLDLPGMQPRLQHRDPLQRALQSALPRPARPSAETPLQRGSQRPLDVRRRAYAYHAIDAPDRLRTPSREAGRGVPASRRWDEAIRAGGGRAEAGPGEARAAGGRACWLRRR